MDTRQLFQVQGKQLLPAYKLFNLISVLVQARSKMCLSFKCGFIKFFVKFVLVYDSRRFDNCNNN